MSMGITASQAELQLATFQLYCAVAKLHRCLQHATGNRMVAVDRTSSETMHMPDNPIYALHVCYRVAQTDSRQSITANQRNKE